MLLLLLLGVLGVAALDPIVARGNRLYNARTGVRFVMRGMTYEGDVSDDHYDEFVRETLETSLTDLFGHFNTFRLYNINPDRSYAKFMAHMNTRGIYVLPSASPTNNKYYGSYATQTMDRTVNGESSYTSIDHIVKPLAPHSKSCYPTYLLYYGKRIIENFAQYDNTLAIVIGNEVLQLDLTAAACVKMYAADLKDWMGVNVKKLRTIPLAYSAADGAYTELVNGALKQVLSATAYHAIKIQGLLCGDTMVHGVMTKSIDMYMINEYRWCNKNTFNEAYKELLGLAQGVPIVLAIGEFGCATKRPRTWEMVPTLFSESLASKGWTDVYSGGFAYAFGEASLPRDSIFPLFIGAADTGITTKPGTTPTPDYANLLQQYKKVVTPLAPAEFAPPDVCSFAPTLTTEPTMPAAVAATWMPSCANPTLKIRSFDTWITKSRQGQACDKYGAPCEVVLPDKVGTTQEDICGKPLVVESGGSLCTPGDSTCKHGSCVALSATAGRCVCSGCWGGSTCAVKDDDKCSVIPNLPQAPKVIFTTLAIFVGGMTLVFGALAVVAHKGSHTSNTNAEVYHAL
ncbi:hypothetical protein SPRG_11957 [Saprolegnia parasitica CBS 223.65]|uniref:EGF-like domain-containing protein n=1 Tax=Saprolegnia parasitica (strain CBS 223.65) TaxID=695850 RepID=A0A067BXW4_SAPPC|nr:hypothetical protein SPRG_11957 [Saprolegnia parasitica CBS 223.65]KDO23113.1 hypothetical protein SPRG_11957 [Saprolegnia parasitica CBS 223.65]|eukprot:XP_012206224.1 hypothetical protein SPRG_11957 [Saprolegnia parasitica CBS 223.65]